MDRLQEIDLNLLVLFDAVYRHRNVSRAAEALGLSQPTVSNGLRRLRTHFDDRLFVRAASGMLPTPAAEALWPAVSAGLAQIGQGLGTRRGFDPARVVRQFSIVMTDIGEVVFLPPLIEHCRRHAPGVSFRTLQLPAAQTARALESGAIDLAVGFVPDLKTGVYQQRLFDTRYVCIAGRAGPERLTRRDFVAARHAVADAEGTGHYVVEQALRALGISAKIGLRVPHFLALPLIVAASDMIATIPQPLASVFRKTANVRVIDPPVKLPTLEIRQFWHERFHDDPGSRWLRATVFELFRDHAWAE
jgi:DNA-binding transcriptional LysR family regulator